MNNYQKKLSKLFKLLNPRIPSIQEAIYINGDKGVITDCLGKKSKPTTDGKQKYKIKTLIQGYKTSNDNIVSPVWRIKKGLLYEK
jgi:hypothetical protein